MCKNEHQVSCLQRRSGTVEVGNGEQLKVKHKGVMTLRTDSDQQLTLPRALVVPGLRHNLLSLVEIADEGCTIVLTKDTALVVRGPVDLSDCELVCEGKREGRFWVLEGDVMPVNCDQTDTTNTKTDTTQPQEETENEDTDGEPTNDFSFSASSSSDPTPRTDTCCDRPTCTTASVCDAAVCTAVTAAVMTLHLHQQNQPNKNQQRNQNRNQTRQD